MSGLLIDRQVVAIGIDNDLGAHICMQLALEGCQVFGIADDREFLAQIKHEIRDARGHFDYVNASTAALADIPEAVELLADRLGAIDSVIVLEADARRWKMNESPSVNGASPDQRRPSPFRTATALVRLRIVQPDSLPTDSTQVVAPGLVADTVVGQIVTERTDESAGRAMGGHVEIVVKPDLQRLEVLANRSNGQGIEIIRSETFSEYDIACGTNVYVQRTDRGRGLFAARDFRKDELVLRTSGRVIDFQTEHSIQIGWNRHVEPDPPIRLINHSCQPNMGVRTNDAGLPDFVALHDIREGEEISFDYAMTEYKHYHRDDPQLEFSLVCRCGSDICRQRLGYYSELSDQLRQAYAGYVSDYLTDIDRSNNPSADAVSSETRP